MSKRARRKDLPEESGKLAPLGVGVSVANIEGLTLELRQRFDFCSELDNAAGSRGLVEDELLRRRKLVFGRLLEVVNILGVESWGARAERSPDIAGAMHEFE